jgi:predicted acylesterase/phospholipase RssA
MSEPRNILRIVLLAAAAGLLAVAASVLREKKETVDLTIQQIEDAISALDPGTRAAVIARLTADAVQQVKERVTVDPDLRG